MFEGRDTAPFLDGLSRGELVRRARQAMMAITEEQVILNEIISRLDDELQEIETSQEP